MFNVHLWFEHDYNPKETNIIRRENPCFAVLSLHSLFSTPTLYDFTVQLFPLRIYLIYCYLSFISFFIKQSHVYERQILPERNKYCYSILLTMSLNYLIINSSCFQKKYILLTSYISQMPHAQTKTYLSWRTCKSKRKNIK